MSKTNYYSDENEWKWLFKNGFDWETILPLYYPAYPTEDGLESKEEVISFYEELLTNTGAWCSESVADRAEKLDIEGAGKIVDGRCVPSPELQNFYNEAKEFDLIGMPFDRKHGGMEMPAIMHLMCLTQLARGCVSQSTQLAFFTSIGELIERYCDEETADRLIPQIAKGNLSGSMCLTEPGCGSDLGQIKTTAVLQEDGTYILNGSKFFITNAGGGLHFVLARIPGAPEGLEGISMFLVEQDINGVKAEKPNYQVVKNEEKMGMHGSFTCEVLYENSTGSLVGKENEGFKYMLHLMNEARIAVGLQALGGIEACLAYAENYAQEREQFGKPLAELPLMARNLKDYAVERDALRAMLVDTLSHYDIFHKLSLKKIKTNDLTEQEEELLEEAQLWTRKRTPLVKYYATELYTTLSVKAIQVLGGYGYMKEYPVERLHRDSFGPLLYEGTSQIQALMALKDVVKYAMKDPARFFSNVLFKHPGAELLNGGSEWAMNFKSTHYRFKKKMVGLLVKCLSPDLSLSQITKALDPKVWASEDKINGLMSHAETLCQALSYMETLRVLCEHANKDETRAELFNDYRNLITPKLEAIYSDWGLR